MFYPPCSCGADQGNYSCTIVFLFHVCSQKPFFFQGFYATSGVDGALFDLDYTPQEPCHVRGCHQTQFRLKLLQGVPGFVCSTLSSLQFFYHILTEGHSTYSTYTVFFFVCVLASAVLRLHNRCVQTELSDALTYVRIYAYIRQLKELILRIYKTNLIQTWRDLTFFQ